MVIQTPLVILSNLWIFGMVNHQKWGDFEVIGSVHRTRKYKARDGDEQIEYMQFSCPYGCSTPVELPKANVSSKKATVCRTHLLECTGVRDGKRAMDDPRVANAVGHGKYEMVLKRKDDDLQAVQATKV